MKLLSNAFFWVTWPITWLFLHGSRRSRVLVVADDSVLLVKHWHGTGHWSLPGGGLHRHETPDAGAVRELLEETGIATDVSQLRDLGVTRAKTKGIGYTAYLYAVELPNIPELHLQRFEIMESEWHKLGDVRGDDVSIEVLRAVRRWRTLV